jgi:histidine triad (HIT) family protein
MQYINNIFTDIIQKKISATILIENKCCICFSDINPQAKIHYLLLPKILCTDFSHFQLIASQEEKICLWDTLQQVIEKLNLSSYKIVTNCGKPSGQEIPHFHVHIMSNSQREKLEA